MGQISSSPFSVSLEANLKSNLIFELNITTSAIFHLNFRKSSRSIHLYFKRDLYIFKERSCRNLCSLILERDSLQKDCHTLSSTTCNPKVPISDRHGNGLGSLLLSSPSRFSSRRLPCAATKSRSTADLSWSVFDLVGPARHRKHTKRFLATQPSNYPFSSSSTTFSPVYFCITLYFLSTMKPQTYKGRSRARRSEGGFDLAMRTAILRIFRSM